MNSISIRSTLGCSAILAATVAMAGAVVCPPEDVVVADGLTPVATFLRHVGQLPTYEPIEGATLAAWRGAPQEEETRSLRLTGYYGAMGQQDPFTTLTVRIDAANQIQAVFVDDVRLRSDIAVLSGGQLQLVGADGSSLVDLTLNASCDDLVALATTQDDPKVQIGITMEGLSPALASQLGVAVESAVLVASVTEGGPAASAGLLMHDVITHLDGAAGVTQDSIREAVQGSEPGTTLTFHVLRGGRLHEVTVAVEAYEDLQGENVTAAWESADRWMRAEQLLRGGNVESVPILSEVPLIGHLFQADTELILTPTLTTTDLLLTRQTLNADGVTLHVTPRIVNEHIVLDTALVSLAQAMVTDATNVDANVVAELQREIAQMKAQIERLESLASRLSEETQELP